MAEGGSGGQRQLVAAILAADVAGYSRLMADDETATITALDDARGVFRTNIAEQGGRVVDTAGDSVLSVFETTAGAVKAAMAIQARLAEINAEIPEPRRMLFRIGIHLGDIHEKADGTIYGDGVNIAARLESLAQPGAVAVSDAVQAALRGRIAHAFADLGEHEVKNIAHPVRAYRVLAEGETVESSRASLRSPRALVAAVIAVVALSGLVAWQISRAPTPDEVAVADPVLALPTGPSIIVLPFINASGDAEQDFFVDGITGDLITALTRFRELFVIAQNTSFTFKGDDTGAVAIGRELGVRFALEGNVRRSANKIRISAQLLDVDSGASLWAQTYERDLTTDDIFAIQDDITGQVVGALADPFGGVIHRIGVANTHGTKTANLDAYECVLRAGTFFRVFSPDAHLEIRTCLERAVKLDPNYAQAWAWLPPSMLMSIYSASIRAPTPLPVLLTLPSAASLSTRITALCNGFWPEPMWGTAISTLFTPRPIELSRSIPTAPRFSPPPDFTWLIPDAGNAAPRWSGRPFASTPTIRAGTIIRSPSIAFSRASTNWRSRRPKK
jgi:adenylate cyclase